jgi:hypothetical protein
MNLEEKYQKVLEFTKQINAGVSVPLKIEVAVDYLFGIADHANRVLKEIGEIDDE